METLKVSIIVPVYNSSKTLVRCLESLMNQTYKDIEVILVDDGSVDNSVEICRCYSRRDSRVVLLSQKNSGPAAARNKGIDYAKGKYLAFVDSDDYVEHHMVESILACAERYDTDMVLYSYYNETDHSMDAYVYDFPTGLYTGDKCNEFTKALIDISSSNRLPPYSWVRLIKKETLLEYDLKYDADIYRSEDFFLFAQLHLKVSSVYVLNEPLYHYRNNASSITNSYVKDYWNMGKKIYEVLMAELPLNNELVDAMFCMLIHRSLLAVHNSSRCNDKSNFLKEIHCVFRDDRLLDAGRRVHISGLRLKLKLYVLCLRAHAFELLEMVYSKKFFGSLPFHIC